MICDFIVAAVCAYVECADSKTTEYLEQFFENLLMGAQHELKNRYLHIDFPTSDISKCQNGTLGDSKSQNGTLNCTLEELAVLQAIANNPSITQKALAEVTGKSERTIKRRTVALQEKGLLRRANGKRSGRWKLLVAL